MGEKRRFGNWDRGQYDDGERWPSKSSRRWGQQNYAGFNTWREEGSSKPEHNGWGNHYPSVPPWVRTFCTSICRVPWRKICDSWRMLSIYKNVAEWDDSAGREAFENAKGRYWARINRLPCNAPLPDPYMYIENVNFDTFLDPELAADLERSFVNPDTDNEVPINHSDTAANKPVQTTGWSEAEQSSTNWDKYIEKPTSGWDDKVSQCDPWETRKNQSVDVNGTDSLWKHQGGWNDGEDPWKHPESWKNIPDRRNCGWNCTSSRQQMADDQMKRSWRDGNSFQKKGNHQRTGYSGTSWRRENAVS